MSHGFDLDRAAVWSPKHTRAREPQRCSVCKEQTAPGKLYVRLASCHEGRWSHTKHCSRCWSIFEAICKRTRGPVDPMLDCGESWLDAFGEVEPPEVASLAFALPGEAMP